MSTCHELSEVYELYALGVLDGEEATALAEHIRTGCPTCSSGVQEALISAALLATMPEQVEPPTRLRKRILDNIGPEKSSAAWAWMSLWAAATAALLIGVIFLNTERSKNDRELAQLRFEVRRDALNLINAHMALEFLDAPETKTVTFGQGKPQPPHGRVLVNAKRGVMLIVANLPPAPAGKIYEMWLIPKGRPPQPAGLFQTDEQGTAMYVREGTLDLANTDAVAVSLEPQRGSLAPTTTPLFVAATSGL